MVIEATVRCILAAEAVEPDQEARLIGTSQEQTRVSSTSMRGITGSGRTAMRGASRVAPARAI